MVKGENETISETEYFILDVLNKFPEGKTVEEIFKEGDKVTKGDQCCTVANYAGTAPLARSTIDRNIKKLASRGLVEVAGTEQRRAMQVRYWRLKDKEWFKQLKDKYRELGEEQRLHTDSKLSQFFFIHTKCNDEGQCTKDRDECWEDKIKLLELFLVKNQFPVKKLTSIQKRKIKEGRQPGIVFRLISFINVHEQYEVVKEEMEPLLRILNIVEDDKE